MIKQIHLIILLLLMTSVVQAKVVKFSVNMTGQILSPQGIHVFGDFQDAAGYGPDWTPGNCLMTKDIVDTNLYHFLVNIPAFAKYEYKYINGDQSYEVEIVPAETQVGYNFDDNRWIYIDSLDADTTELAAVMFNGNAPMGLTSVRFLVDMTLQTIPASGAHVAGSHQGNDPTTDRLFSFGNQIYEIINYLPSGSYSYKFYNGNTLASSETVPASCATSGLRTFNLVGDVILNTYCFSTCNANCFPAAVPTFVDENAIKIYPNPCSGSTTVNLSSAHLIQKVAVLDMSGRMVQQLDEVNSSLVQIEQLRTGIYSLLVTIEGGETKSFKLIAD